MDPITATAIMREAEEAERAVERLISLLEDHNRIDDSIVLDGAVLIIRRARKQYARIAKREQHGQADEHRID